MHLNSIKRVIICLKIKFLRSKIGELFLGYQVKIDSFGVEKEDLLIFKERL